MKLSFLLTVVFGTVTTANSSACRSRTPISGKRKSNGTGNVTAGTSWSCGAVDGGCLKSGSARSGAAAPTLGRLLQNRPKSGYVGAKSSRQFEAERNPDRNPMSWHSAATDAGPSSLIGGWKDFLSESTQAGDSYRETQWTGMKTGVAVRQELPCASPRGDWQQAPPVETPNGKR